MKSKRVKAFTLTEMIVVMMITAIVIGMAYSVFQIISKSYASFSEKNEKVNEAERLEHWLGRDMLRSDACFAGDSSIALVISRDTVRYAFGDTVVTRLSARTDRFKLKTTGFQTGFRGAAGAGKLADELRFNILLEGQDIPEVFSKSYSAEQLINLDYAIDRHQ